MAETVPDYIGIGFRRCASSWLHETLYQHPQIRHYRASGATWGAHFFSRDEQYANGFDTYAESLGQDEPGTVVGEMSDSYTYPEYAQAAAERIALHCPQAKLLCVVRNPVDRAFSDYRRSVNLAEISLSMSFEQALEAEPLFVERGRYAQLLEPYRPFLDAGRLLVVVNEEIRENPERVVSAIYSYLGVDADFRPDHLRRKVGHASLARNQFAAKLIRGVETRISPVLRRAGLGGMLDGLNAMGVQKRIKAWNSREVALPAEIRSRVLPQFRKDIRNLESMLERNFTVWLGANE